MNAKYSGTTIKIDPQRMRAAVAQPPPIGKKVKSDETTTETSEFDGFVVLAFICKRLPKSPNPDANLKWQN